MHKKPYIRPGLPERIPYAWGALILEMTSGRTSGTHRHRKSGCTVEWGLSEPLTYFDLMVSEAITALYLSKREDVTVKKIWELLRGTPERGRGGVAINTSQKACAPVVDSVERLRRASIHVKLVSNPRRSGIREAADDWGPRYVNVNKAVFLPLDSGYILPALCADDVKIVTSSHSDTKTTPGVHILEPPALYSIGALFEQIQSLPHSYFVASRKNEGKNSLMIKNYVLRRFSHMFAENNGQHENRILYSSLPCSEIWGKPWGDLSSDQQRGARIAARKQLDHLENLAVIASWTPHTSGRQILGINVCCLPDEHADLLAAK